MAYVAVVLTGASTSSLGIWALRERPGAPLGTMWGDPVGLRSDEFLTQTSLELNVLSLGHSSHSPLAHGPDLVFQLSSGQPFETLFFLESNLLRLGPWLPDTMLFAAVRALPLLVLALTLPRLLRRLGATRPLSWLAFTLVVAAPTSLWWSFTPVRILAFASLGGFLLVLAKEHWVRATRRSSYAVALALAAAGGIATARLGTYYIPWCLTIGVPLVVAVAAWLVTGPPRRAGWIVLGTGALSGAVLLGLTMWENSTALRATLATVYPGLRRSNGEAVQPFELFGAPGLTYLQDGRPVAVLNQSEISSAFLVCLVWALLLVGLRRRTSVEATAALWGLAGTIAVWLAWIVAPWGAWAQQLPLLSLVPPARAAQTLGFAAALLVCLLLSQTRPSGTARALTAGACATVVTVYGVASLRLALPELTPALVLLPALVVGVVVALVTRWPSRALVIGPVCALLVLAGIGVNPIVFGLGDLRASEAAGAAREIGATARREQTYVAADNEFVSALMVGNGVPMITGWQISGPDRDAWEALDPDGSEEELWNRGASYLRMSFTGAPGSAPAISTPNPDIVLITVDPCGIPDELDVGLIVSSSRLEAECLQPRRTFTWSGQKRHVYAVLD